MKNLTIDFLQYIRHQKYIGSKTFQVDLINLMDEIQDFQACFDCLALQLESQIDNLSQPELQINESLHNQIVEIINLIDFLVSDLRSP